MIFLLIFPSCVLVLAVLLLIWVAQWALYVTKSRPISKALVYSIIAFTLIAIATYIYPTRPFILRGRQVQSLGNMQIIRSLLSKYKDTHGQYPDQLAPAFEGQPYSVLLNGWGNSFVYETRAEGYLLIGLGSDGKQDHLDYWRLRKPDTPCVSVQGIWAAGQVASDIGWHQEAGK